jgi:hypothetical protein
MKKTIGRIVSLCIVSVLWVLPVDAKRKSKKEYLIAIKTEYGTMRIVLSKLRFTEQILSNWLKTSNTMTFCFTVSLSHS